MFIWVADCHLELMVGPNPIAVENPDLHHIRKTCPGGQLYTY